MIIAISDSHLGDLHSNKKDFISFVQDFLEPNQDEISHLVLLGDILDFWRKNTAVVIHNHSHIFDTLSSLDFETHYLVGNHDFALSNPQMTFRDDISIHMNLSLSEGNYRFRFIHGHQLSYWYALPFYEFFSNAMCLVAEDDGPSAIWSVFQNNQFELPSFIAEIINTLSVNKKEHIEDTLASTHLTPTYNVDETFIREYKLLNRFVDFSPLQTRNPAPLIEEMESLSSEISSLSDGEVSIDTFLNSTQYEIAQSYLKYWIQICEWSRTNNKLPIMEKVLGNMRRIVAMLTVGLEPDEFLVHGHRHKMMIDQKNRIADAGCWIGDKGSFILISDGKVNGARWPKK
jgi:UDP-2,3-diacylglucosamine pyrophosphatase LpxH